MAGQSLSYGRPRRYASLSFSFCVSAFTASKSGFSSSASKMRCSTCAAQAGYRRAQATRRTTGLCWRKECAHGSFCSIITVHSLEDTLAKVYQIRLKIITKGE